MFVIHCVDEALVLGNSAVGMTRQSGRIRDFIVSDA
jgi:hypothetical protein